MTIAQFNEAFKIFQSDKDLQHVDDSVLFGCFLPDFKPVVITVEVVAKFMRWQLQMLNGGIDMQELNDEKEIFAGAGQGTNLQSSGETNSTIES